MTRKLTWTFGLRDTFNSNPLNPHDQIARLRGSFDSISHDVNQPLNAAIQTGLGNVFSSTPLAILQPRTAIAWQFEPKSVLRAGFGIFSDILPGSVADVVGVESALRADLPGRPAGHGRRHGDRAGRAEQRRDATAAANQTFSLGISRRASFPALRRRPIPQRAFRPSRSPRCPTANFTRLISWNGASASSTNSERTASVRAQYVGTRAVNQPYLTQVNGYQTVCQGCFAPFPYAQPTDPRFGAVTQLSTGANSHYNGLQLTAMKRLGHGLQGQVNYTWSRCMDKVSNGGFLQFSAGGILSPLPGDLARDYGPCDYDIRHNLNAQYVYQLPIKVRNRALGYALNGWQISGTVFWHSGIPFSVLSTPYSANGNGIVNGSGPQFASVVPGVPLYEHNAIPGVTQPGTIQWLNPECVRFDRGSRAPAPALGGDSSAELPVRKPGTQRVARPRFCLERFLSHEMVSR